jgi:hypothetical protein
MVTIIGSMFMITCSLLTFFEARKLIINQTCSFFTVVFQSGYCIFWKKKQLNKKSKIRWYLLKILQDLWHHMFSIDFITNTLTDLWISQVVTRAKAQVTSMLRTTQGKNVKFLFLHYQHQKDKLSELHFINNVCAVLSSLKGNFICKISRNGWEKRVRLLRFNCVLK